MRNAGTCVSFLLYRQKVCVMTTIFPDVERTTKLVQGLKCPWWFAGGWALDLFLGRQTRPHKDVEIAIARADQQHLLPLPDLAGIEFVEHHEKKSWRGKPLELPVHELYARFYGGAEVEVLLNEFEGADWVYRRNKNISLPKAKFAGQKFLPPEIVLLFKSKKPRAEDQQDFDAVLSHLGAPEKAWLAGSIARDYPGHPWLAKLKGQSLSGAARGKF